MQEFILKPWHLVVLFLASQFNREQHLAIEYLRTETKSIERCWARDAPC